MKLVRSGPPENVRMMRVSADVIRTTFNDRTRFIFVDDAKTNLKKVEETSLLPVSCVESHTLYMAQANCTQDTAVGKLTKE